MRLLRRRVGRRCITLAGGKDNSCSILEAFQLAEQFSGKAMCYTYVQEKSHWGTISAYYSDLSKMRQHYPNWYISVSLEETVRQIVEAWQVRLDKEAVTFRALELSI